MASLKNLSSKIKGFFDEEKEKRNKRQQVEQAARAKSYYPKTNIAQKAWRTATKPLVPAQRFVESPKQYINKREVTKNMPINMQVSRTAQNIPLEIGQYATGTISDIGRNLGTLPGVVFGNRYAPTYESYKSPASRLGRNIIGEQRTLPEVWKNFAGTAKPILGAKFGQQLWANPATTAKFVGTSSALGGILSGGASAIQQGINKATGQEVDKTAPLRSAGQGAAESLMRAPYLYGALQYTSPVLSKAFDKTAPTIYKSIQSRAGQQAAGAVANRLVPAVFNVLEGLGIDRMLGLDTTAQSVAIDAIVGMIMGPGSFGANKIEQELKKAFPNATPQQIAKATEQITYVRDPYLSEEQIRANRQQVGLPTDTNSRSYQPSTQIEQIRAKIANGLKLTPDEMQIARKNLSIEELNRAAVGTKATETRDKGALEDIVDKNRPMTPARQEAEAMAQYEKGRLGEVDPTKIEPNVTKGSLYDIELYRGTGGKKLPDAGDNNFYGRGTYLTDNPETAKQYGTVSKHRLTANKILGSEDKLKLPEVKKIVKSIDEQTNSSIGSNWLKGQIEWYEGKLPKDWSTNYESIKRDLNYGGEVRDTQTNIADIVNNAVKKLGYEGISYGDTTGLKGTNYVIFDNKNISNVAQPPISDLSKQRPGEAGFIRIGKEPAVKVKNTPLIEEAKTKIGGTPEEPKLSIKQHLDNLYTQWVDRYQPISGVSKQARKAVEAKGAQLRPEVDPSYAVRRLTGAAGIADYRFKTELQPVLKELESSGISKSDMDVYLAHKRQAGFGKVGRDIYGSDPVKSQKIVNALEAKYGQPIIDIANKMYVYQDKGFDELIKAGFIDDETAKLIREQNPDYAPLQRVMDKIDTYLGVPTRKTQQATNPVEKTKGSERNIISPVESIIGNTYRQRAAIEKNAVAKQIVDLQKITDLGFEKVAKSGDDTITVWRDGNKEYWRVGKDIAEVAKASNEENINLVLKILQQPAALLRQGATGRNPAFMIPNIVRDQLDASIASKYGYIPFVDYVSGLKSMLTNDEVYQSWQRSGAKIDLGELSGQKQISEAIDEKAASRNLWQWLTAGLDVIGKYSEQPTRVGLYKKAYNATGNEMLAMMNSRDATVDFARMGTKMKVANSVIPFLNVQLQGFDKLIRATKDQPLPTALKMGTFAAAPAVMTTLYNLLNHPEEYKEIPDYDKNDNFVFVTGRNPNGSVDYVSIPKGNIVPVVANPIQSFLEYAYDNDNANFKQTAYRTLSEFIPILGEGGSPREIAIKTVGQNLPQAMKPATESLINRSFYKYDEKNQAARDIVPYYMMEKPAYQRSYEFTPEMYKKIGAALNMSPLQVKNLMEGYLAGYAKTPAQAIELLTKLSKNEPITPNEIPIAYRFKKQTYPSKYKIAPKEEPKSPGFFKRITDTAEAAEETTGEYNIPSSDKALEELYKDVVSRTKSYQTNLAKVEAGLVNKTMEEYRDEFTQAANIKKEIENQYPEKVFDIELGIYKSGGSANVEERAKWAYEKLNNITDEADFEKAYKRMLDEGVLTKSVIEAINETYNENLNEYIEGGKVKTLSGTTKSGRKSGGKTKTWTKLGRLPAVGYTKLSPLPVPSRSRINITPPKIISPQGYRRIAQAAPRESNPFTRITNQQIQPTVKLQGLPIGRRLV